MVDEGQGGVFTQRLLQRGILPVVNGVNSALSTVVKRDTIWTQTPYFCLFFGEIKCNFFGLKYE